MTIKRLLTHFDNENKLTIKESNYDRIEWYGIARPYLPVPTPVVSALTTPVLDTRLVIETTGPLMP